MPRGPAPVDARVSVPAPDNHLVVVTLTIPALDAPGARRLAVPRWIPGSYKIRDFARHVQDLRITARGNKAIPVHRGTTDGWHFHDPATGPLTVSYKVYCRDLTVDTSHVTKTHLYVHGVTLFAYDETLRHRPWRVTVEVPKGWRIWCGLPEERKGAKTSTRRPDRSGRTVYLADDYDHLVDCPIEAGDDHHEERFRAAGRPHTLVVWNPPAAVDWKKVVRHLRGIIEEAAAIFGGLPYSDYTFIAHVAKGHGGGLEHKNSTVLGVDPLHLTDPKPYQTRFLPLVAHEFFHVWNVRRIQPAAFVPFDYQREVLTSLLWLFEGGTSYYEIPIMLRSKVADTDKTLEVLAEMVKWTEAVPGRYRLSVADASRLTWTKLYQRHESNVNTNVSYYSKGALVCLCLDAHLRRRGSSLDVVMKHLWEHYGAKGIGVPDDGLAAIVKEATGVPVAAQLRRWVDEPGELPVDAALRTLGLSIKRDQSDKDAPLGLGVMLEDDALKVTMVPDRWDSKDGAPRRPEHAPDVHPLDPGDEIVAVDGWKVTKSDLAAYVNRHKKGETAEVTLFRDGRLRTVAVPVVTKVPDKIKIDENKKADATAKRRRAAWKRPRARRNK